MEERFDEVVRFRGSAEEEEVWRLWWDRVMKGGCMLILI
jgi:hypothetical protein